MKFSTSVSIEPLSVRLNLTDKLFVLGSCFADSMGRRLRDAGFDVCINPFGTLYNPASILSATLRLDSREAFTAKDCVEMGAGSSLKCSFHHHTSFARESEREFLECANAALAESADKWQACTKVIITLGTAQVWKRLDGSIVSNCLKRPAREFTHETLSVGDVTGLMAQLVSCHPEKQFIFTVSPIRHMGEGAHVNTISKSILQLGLHGISAPGVCYFPSYEILLDELRDYRFYADDLVHPSPLAEEFIWERFLEAAVPASEHEAISHNVKSARHAAHRPLRQA